MKKFDYILSGGGCAGLSLAYHLINSRLNESKILIIDPSLDRTPNKTWCYWHNLPLPIHPKDKIHSWSGLAFKDQKKTLKKELGNLKYFHLNSHDFFNSLKVTLQNHPSITFLEDQVVNLTEKDQEIWVETNTGGVYSADLVFDSRINSKELYGQKLKQVFLGWKIETQERIFQPDRFTMMDFNTQTGELFDFFYVLPFSATEALVEYTTYTTEEVPENILQERLQKYLKSITNNENYLVTFRESGVIPMSTKTDSGNNGKKIIPIGTRAGWTKPSTGYTFHQIQDNCKKIVENLEKGKLENLHFNRKSRFVFYDAILLNIAHRWPSELKKVFLDLFQSAPTDLVFRFLSEKTSFIEELRLLSGLKFGIFIRSLINYESR